MTVTPGQILLNKYRVDAFLASGGMGAVYRAWDLERQAPLAMKVLHTDPAEDPVMFRRFQREAHTLEQLAHPHIVPFYGLFQTSDFAFLLEQFINGPSLQELLKKQNGKPLPLETSMAIAKALCSALGYAHAKNVIHCDIKPANVLIDNNGQIYLADFGIARNIDSTTTTLAGAGTVAYMAPEQVQVKTLSARTDIYSLGVLIYELLTGERPFTGSEPVNDQREATTSERIRYAHVHLPPPDPCKINSKVTPAMRKVLLKALEKDPINRYISTLELYMALCDAYGETTTTVPDLISPSVRKNYPPPANFPAGVPPPIANVNSVKKKNTLPLLLGGVSLVLVVIIGTGIAIGNAKQSQINWPSSKPVNEQVSPQTGNDLVPTIVSVVAATSSAGNNIIIPTQIVEQLTTAPAEAKPGKTETFVEWRPLDDCHTSRLHVGQSAIVNNAGKDFLFLRSYADTHPSDNIIGKIYNGNNVEIISGPVCNWDWLLWEVRTSAGEQGWMAEWDTDNYLLTPEHYDLTCGANMGSRLQVGDEAYVIVDESYSYNNVRVSPSKSAKVVTKIEPTKTMTILEGPRCADGYVWWRVQDHTSGKEGWTVERSLEGFALAPVN